MAGMWERVVGVRRGTGTLVVSFTWTSEADCVEAVVAVFSSDGLATVSSDFVLLRSSLEHPFESLLGFLQDDSTSWI